MSVPCKLFFFKPKPDAQTKLVVVAAEADKNIGSASNLAKVLGFKDMRSAEDSHVQSILSVSKAEGLYKTRLRSVS